MTIDPRLHRIVTAQPYPLLFATISGAHLYGFPSPDSDFDLRGAHVLPVEQVVGLDVRHETVEDSRVIEGLEMDIVSHDARKFFGLLLKKNGYVLEQLFSPLIVHTTPEHHELKRIARGCITKHHSHHYFGFAETQWNLFDKERPRHVKPLLYVYRVLLTGIHLMRTGKVEANLVKLNEEFRLPYIPDLVARKLSGPEKSILDDADMAFHEREYQRLRGELQAAHEASQLPELPSDETRAALNDLLMRVRLKPSWPKAAPEISNAQSSVRIKRTAPLMPARLDWPSAIGNFLLNFSTLDLSLLDCLESRLAPTEFAKVKEWHFRDRIECLKTHLAGGGYPQATLDNFERVFNRIDLIRELRNHIAHGVIRLGMTSDHQSWEVTLTLPRDLNGEGPPDARHVPFEELETAIQELPKLIDELSRLI
jgi:predicted nucleotidyltransferase